MVIRGFNAMKRRTEGRPEPEAPAEPPPVPAEERLLSEIRDLLAGPRPSV